MALLKAVHYINQFYAGLGGETMAHVGLSVLEEKKGPAIGLEKFWNGEMEVVNIIVCGDNYINNDDNFQSIIPEIKNIINKAKPDVFIAGPAFNAGRYGVACAKLCDYVRRELGIPSVTAMWHENPAVDMFVRDNYIVATSETAVGMSKSLPGLAKLALKLAKKELIGPARFEGYLRTGHRYNEYNEKTGAERVLDILLNKLGSKPYLTEIPLRGFEAVAPASKVTELKAGNIALITTGGLVPMGNPDKIKQAFAVTYGRYDMEGVNSLNRGVYESIHGGYDTTFATNDPHRLIPLDEMRNLEKDGVIGGVYKYFFTTCGVGTNVESSKNMGRGIAAELKSAGVSAAILTTT
ncbi:MAG: glycine reductase [Clostridiales bacterium]|nr:glycine reductase [Clostridiales bacterium]